MPSYHIIFSLYLLTWYRRQCNDVGTSSRVGPFHCTLAWLTNFIIIHCCWELTCSPEHPFLALCFFSAVDCEADLVYTDAMSPCGHSCADLNATVCTLPDPAVPEEGCVCPGGNLTSGDECVTPDNCGCMLDNGIYLKVNTT